MKTQFSVRARAGFTLIEMLVTITIVVILAGLSLGGFKYVSGKQAMEQSRIQLSLLEKAIEEYKLDNGEYPPAPTAPTIENGNTNILYKELYLDGKKTPNTDKIYLAELDPNNRQGWIIGSEASAKIVDPWGKEYQYKAPGSHNPDFDLHSYGADGKTGGNKYSQDDIKNW
ncbi:type II secretion system protein GspG [Luteolibacter algae]|uniref:Type II secretion system protein GspG n=1 Tax=Luteolibacter algae TaxID=454151 RepID=A0ABW5DA79_9BACT